MAGELGSGLLPPAGRMGKGRHRALLCRPLLDLGALASLFFFLLHPHNALQKMSLAQFGQQPSKFKCTNAHTLGLSNSTATDSGHWQKSDKICGHLGNHWLGRASLSHRTSSFEEGGVEVYLLSRKELQDILISEKLKAEIKEHRKDIYVGIYTFWAAKNQNELVNRFGRRWEGKLLLFCFPFSFF